MVRPEFRKPGETVLQKQWHGRFGRLASHEVAFIAVLSVNCDANMPEISHWIIMDTRYGWQRLCG